MQCREAVQIKFCFTQQSAVYSIANVPEHYTTVDATVVARPEPPLPAAEVQNWIRGDDANDDERSRDGYGDVIGRVGHQHVLVDREPERQETTDTCSRGHRSSVYVADDE